MKLDDIETLGDEGIEPRVGAKPPTMTGTWGELLEFIRAGTNTPILMTDISGDCAWYSYPDGSRVDLRPNPGVEHAETL